MTFNVRNTLRLLATTLLIGICAGQAFAKDNPAKWAPKNTVLYVGVPNCDKMVKSLKKTALYKMSQDSDLSEAVQPFKKFFENAKSVMAEELGLDSPKDLEVYPEGPIAAYLAASSQVDDDGVPLHGIALIMDMGEKLEATRSLSKKIVDACLSQGGNKDKKEVAGTSVTIVRFKKEGDAEEINYARVEEIVEKLFDGVEVEQTVKMGVAQVLGGVKPPDEFAFAFSESRLILASDFATVSDAIKRLNGKDDDTFASSKAMRSLRKRCSKKAHLQFVFNTPEFLDIVKSVRPDASKQISASGLSAIGPFVMTTQFAPSSKLDFVTKGYLEIDGGERVGIAKILLMENSKTAPLATVPADVLWYASMNLNPAVVLEEVIAITARIDPAEADQMRAGMVMPLADGSTLDIRKEVVAQMTGPLSMMMNARAPYAAADFGAYIHLGHSSREGINKLLTGVFAGMLMPSDMMGQTVYSVPPVPGLSLAVTEKAFLVATKKAAENYIREEGKSGQGLADDKTFKAVVKRVPKKTCMVMYGDSRRMLAAQEAIARMGDARPNSPPPFGMPASAFVRWAIGQNIDPDMIKHADAMRKYQTSGIATISTESDGLRFDLVAIPVRGKK